MKQLGVICTTGLALLERAAQDTKTLLIDTAGFQGPGEDRKRDGRHDEAEKQRAPVPEQKYVWETTFNAGDDWLKDLSIVIKNVSEKKIVYVVAGCLLYETANWQAEVAKAQPKHSPGRQRQ